MKNNTKLLALLFLVPVPMNASLQNSYIATSPSTNTAQFTSLPVEKQELVLDAWLRISKPKIIKKNKNKPLSEEVCKIIFKYITKRFSLISHYGGWKDAPYQQTKAKKWLNFENLEGAFVKKFSLIQDRDGGLRASITFKGDDDDDQELRARKNYLNDLGITSSINDLEVSFHISSSKEIISIWGKLKKEYNISKKLVKLADDSINNNQKKPTNQNSYIKRPFGPPSYHHVNVSVGNRLFRSIGGKSIRYPAQAKCMERNMISEGALHLNKAII